MKKHMINNYPFRFEGVKVGDVVYWACVDEDGNDLVLETKISGIHDSYYFMDRNENDPPKETWCIFYDIEDYKPHSLTFGDALFLTREEALEFSKS